MMRSQLSNTVFDDFQLSQRTAVGLVFPAVFYLPGNEFERFGDNRKIFTDKPPKAVIFGHGQLYQVTERPRNRVPGAMQEAVFFPGGADNGSNLACDRRLFAQYTNFHFGRILCFSQVFHQINCV
jgi:hypothetical protein